MKNTNRFALAAVSGLGLAAMAAAPALAADVTYEEPPAPAPIIDSAPVATWAGPYAGVQFGYGFGGRAARPGDTIRTDGWLGGVFGGYNFQQGQFVYGVEGDVNFSGVEGSSAITSARSRVDGSLRARVGVVVTDDLLLYGTAGGAAESLRLTDGATGARDSNTMLGYTVGAGVDARLTEQVFARGEYRFTDYARETFDLGAGPERYDSSNHRFTVGVGFKF